MGPIDPNADQAVPWSPARSVAAYAQRFHAALGRRHAAASPLGAYLLLAAMGPAISGHERVELERILGGTVEQANRWLDELLRSPHPAIAAAFAVWHHRAVENEYISGWLRSLPKGLDRGAIPDQSAADAWAREATRGAIDRFPVEINPLTRLLLASALATSVTWEDPFTLAPSGELGNASWAQQVKHVLCRHVIGHRAIARTESAGLVAAELSFSTKGLLVTSVIAESQVEPDAVMAAAHEVAALASNQPSSASFVSLFDLPLGRGHAWELTEHPFMSEVKDMNLESARVLIPAWTVELSTIDLSSERSWGIQAATDALMKLYSPIDVGYTAQAKQAVRAEFNRHGFSASAVSVVMVDGAAGGWSRRPDTWPSRRRHAETRFARPFAVVAIAQKPHGHESLSHWSGIPVFSAWVTTPVEAEAGGEYEPYASPGHQRPGLLRRLISRLGRH